MALVTIPRRRSSQQLPQLKILNPGKGLNNFVTDQLIRDDEASDLLNIQFVESGCPSKSYGMTSVGTGLSNNPKGLGVLYTTSVRQVVTVDGTQLKYLNGSVWTAIAGVTFTTAKETNFCQIGDASGTYVFIWNGTDTRARYDGTTLAQPANGIAGSAAISYQGRQMAFGVASNPNRLYISSSTDPSVFSGGSSATADVNLGDGDAITALAKFQEKLIIFKERSIYEFTFDSSGTPVISQITSSIGCVGHKSVDNVDNDVFFLSRLGYRVLGNEPSFFNTIRTNDLSARIKPTIDTISSGNLSKTASIFSDYKFYSSITTGGSSMNNKSLTYDKRYLAWSILDYIKANAWTEFIDSTGTKHLYYSADDEAQVYEIGTSYSANGTAISSRWVSKAFDAGNFEIDKQWIDITFLFRQILGSVVITVYSDNDQVVKTSSISTTTDTTGSMGTGMLGANILGGTGNAASGTSTNNVPYRLKVSTKSRTLKVKISNANNNESFTLLGMIITYVPFGHFKFDSAHKIY